MIIVIQKYEIDRKRFPQHPRSNPTTRSKID